MSVRKVAGNSRIAEVDTVAGLIVAAHAEAAIAGDAHLPGLMEELTAGRAALQAAIQQTKAESALAEIDALRDEKYRALGHLINGATYHPATKVQEAARALDATFEKYGHPVAAMSYNEESSHITNLLEELAQEPLVEKSVLVHGVTVALEELTTAQEAFDTSVSQWKADKGSDGAVTPASTLRKELILLLNTKFVPYISIMTTLDSTLYGAFSQAVSEIINDHNENVKKRKN